MSKNLTRKGFALGTVLALGASLFAGTPASAAPTALYLDTAFGTSGASQTGVLGQYFTLAASANGAASSDVVSFFVEGVTAANLTATGRFVTDLETDTATSAYVSRTPSATSNDLKQATVTSPSTWVVGNYYQLGLKVNSTNVTATTSVKVTPFLDSVVADGKPGAGELAGSPVTINFVKGSELTATPTLTTVTVGSTVKASVAVTGGVNLSQFRAAAKGGHAETPFTVDFKQTGADWASNVDRNALWNTTTSVLEATSANNAGANLVYGATANINATDSGVASAATATAGEVSALSSNVTIDAGTSYRATGTVGNTANVIRAGSGTVTASVDVTTVTAGKSVAGQKVTFLIKEVTAATLPAGATIAAGGKTLTIAKSATVEELEVVVTTDADGNASLPISYTGVTSGDTFQVSASAVSATGAATGGAAITLTGQDSIARAIVDPIQRAQAGTAVRHIAKGGSFSIAYTVVDQFGQTPTGTFRVVATNTNALVTPSITSPIAVSAGKVTVSGTDNNTATDTYEVVATLQKLGTDGVTYADLTTAVTQTSTISAGTAKTAATIAITATTTADIVRNGAALKAGSFPLEQGSVSRTLAGGQTMSAVVTDAAGALVPGAAVTFTATGVLFQAGGTQVTNDGTYGLGSITVYTDASGSTGNVYYYSNNTGKQTVTVTSGAATKTQAISWAAVTAGGSAWTVDAPVRVLPGTTLKVSAVLKDKFGALVNSAAGDIKVTYTGPGYVTSTIATETDADGVVSFTVLLGAADAGTATVKFIYEGANNTLEETTLNDDVVATATIAIGAAPVSAATAAVSGSKGKFFVSATNAAAKKVVVKVAGKFFGSFTGTAAKKSVALKAPKGSHKVTVFVGGKLVATKTVTVK